MTDQALKKYFPLYTQPSLCPKTICAPLVEEVFGFPFFNEGLSHFRLEQTELKTTLDEIQQPASDSLLTLAGFIFHTSHCGSTLLGRMLHVSPKVRVVSETEAINGLLISYLLNDLPEQLVLEQLKQIIEAYLQPLGKAQKVVFKLSSWNVFLIHLFQKQYPEVSWLYLDRNSDDVIRSLLKSSGGMENWFYQPTDTLRKHFVGENFEGTKNAYLSILVQQHQAHALDAKNNYALMLKYPSFLNKFESQIIPHFGLDFTAEDLLLAKEQCAYDAKSNGKKRF
jgi:hypothetical protein